ncbi:MAG: ABC transporter ATP-binding protein [Pseudomonadota bacterium]|nr:MAG: ABC transporter ATP-binding protein [Pseudomonadota bacterium]
MMSTAIAASPTERTADRRETVLRLEGITKVYRAADIETIALQGIHLTVASGDFVAIEGPSGSGKTTLLSVLGLLEQASSGRYSFCGEDVSRLSPRERARRRNRDIGFVFQDFSLIGDLTVAENVELPLLYGKVAKAERRARVERALERVGMTHRKNHYPSQLSGGQQQRVAVARAVVSQPKILLADEPTGNLDSKNGAAIMDLLLSLHQAGTTILMVSHNPAFSRLAERVLQLNDGQITGEDRIAPGSVGR